MIKFPFKMRNLPLFLSLQKKYILKQKFWGRENTKAFTLHKDGDWGKVTDKPKETMLRANKGDKSQNWKRSVFCF